MKKLFEKNDLLVIIIIAAIAIILLIPHFFKQDNLTAVITVNGETAETVDLNKINGVREITLKSDPQVKVRIEKGRICVCEAECKDKLCVKCGWLDSPGDAAVCLPAKVVIALSGESGTQDEKADIITY